MSENRVRESGSTPRGFFRGQVQRVRDVYRLPASIGAALIVAPWVVSIALCGLIIDPSTRNTGIALIHENGWLENLTVLADGMAGILGLLLARRARGAGHPILAMYYALAGGFFLVLAAEELDWGQRIFHWKTPAELAAVNLHEATNLHNMPGLEDLEYPVIFTIALVGILCTRLFRNPRLRPASVPTVLISCLVVILIMAIACLRPFGGPPAGSRLDMDLYYIEEVMEMVLGFAGWLYMWLNGRMLAPEWGAPASPSR